MTTRTIVIDPGRDAGGLRAARHALDRLSRHGGVRLVLADGALGPRERARVAFHNAADVFVCLSEGRDAELATDPRLHHPSTRRLRLRGRAAAGIAEDVERYLAATVDEACACPGCGCPGWSTSMSGERRDDGVVRVQRETIDVWNEVPMVPQRTGMSCWAAAAAMVVGWRDASDVDPEQIARAAQRWDAYEDGLEPEDVPALARRWGLHREPPGRYSLADFRDLLVRHGPLWVGEASPGLHSVVLTGMRGDGTPDGTMLHIADPWPLGRGERYSVTFREFLRNFEAAAGVEGVDAQILHAGGRGHGPSGSTHIRETVTARSWTTQRG